MGVGLVECEGMPPGEQVNEKFESLHRHFEGNKKKKGK